MENSLIGILEILLVFGLALGFGVFQLVSVRIERQRDRERQRDLDAPERKA